MSSFLIRLLTLFVVTTPNLFLCLPAKAATHKSSKLQTMQTHSKSKNQMSVLLGKAEQLNLLYDKYWDDSMRLNPLQATLQGDAYHGDRMPNFLSAEFRKQHHDFIEKWLKKVEMVGADGLDGQAFISYQIFVRDARNSLHAERYPNWMLPINQFYNIANVAVVLGSGNGAQPFNTVQDYDNWAHRSLGIPALFNQAIVNMRLGMKSGVVQPKVLMEKVIPQLDSIIKPTAEETLFWVPIRNMSVTFSNENRQRITAEYKSIIEYRLLPAYRALRNFIATEYLPVCRDSVGLSALPGGASWYAYTVRQSTTTNMTPEQIHQLGLKEVARLQAEIQSVMHQLNFNGSMQKFFSFMQNNEYFTFGSEKEMLAYYRDLRTRVEARVPALFSLVPKAGFEILPVEAFRAPSAAAGSYMPPSSNRRHNGVFYANTNDLSSRRTWNAEKLFLHEGIPGYHFQLGLQQELRNLPKFRRLGGETAFIEGWGLYAESLGKELGLYQDAYNYFGYLQDALSRAIRLVVDTGLHTKGWTRAQVVDYIVENSATSPIEAEAEVDRYIAIPGQALAYKVGELKIHQLRQYAQLALGPMFDLREFHAEILKDGSVPLDILQQKIERWIAVKRVNMPSISHQKSRDQRRKS
ncbi:DUF885 domain-containing protein [Xylella fastidiosa]|uniref:DUF885 domain-containing protein n=1 Tax=Xylella fastidiosa subsp. sandyi Ann-1 TaxID=155920 RepID=A0A060H1X9_XYLFS|nr:DUF885 family protein [Xylella fastidiosa]AIC09310.1 hypothetical protein D934_01690 [Xylella fastidiosa subsp. sandyi Ann-1]UIX81452.1 DUF885 family protein [Xylella fastidiosa subsp. sandyi]